VRDDLFSTTALLTKEQPSIEREIQSKIHTKLFLNKEDIIDLKSGGLRTKGYFKKSHKSKPIVTIITVVFNGEKFLEETIKSIINQQYDNIEYIIVDGGSTDSTLKILEQYDNVIDYWVSKKDDGMYDALNTGLTLSTGKLINFTNSDDILCDEATIQRIVNEFNKEGFDCCYGSAKFINEKSEIIGWHKPLNYKKRYHVTLGSFFVQPTFFWSRDIMKKVGYFDLTYKIISDRDFITRVALASKNIKKLDFCISLFRKFVESFGDRSAEITKRESPLVTNKYKKLLNVNDIIINFLTFYDRVIQKLSRTSYIKR
jgi:glycosyltransferase involved in cell wall biosynthesis